MELFNMSASGLKSIADKAKEKIKYDKELPEIKKGFDDAFTLSRMTDFANNGSSYMWMSVASNIYHASQDDVEELLSSDFSQLRGLGFIVDVVIRNQDVSIKVSWDLTPNNTTSVVNYICRQYVDK